MSWVVLRLMVGSGSDVVACLYLWDVVVSGNSMNEL
jgi:hypothetical protein